MNPFTHALIGWAVANTVPSLERRERAIIFFGSLVPDLDGLTILGGAQMFQEWHRIIGHNVAVAVASTAVAAALARKRRGLVAALYAVNFHTHLFCDYLGSAGPDGSGWGIPYLQPFSAWTLYNPYQWGLASWQNFLISAVFAGVAIGIGRRFGRSPLEPISLKAEAGFMDAIRKRFGSGAQP